MNLPDDIVDEILLLLPVNSLGRFRVVCKDWYSHIHSKSFIAKHIKNQRGKEKILIYHNRYHRIGYPSYLVSICSGDEKQLQDEEEDGDAIRTLFHTTKQQQYFIEHMPLEHLKNYNYVQADIIGTCNGIVCFANNNNFSAYDKIITLWNPTTREFNTLPPFQLQCPQGTSIYSDNVGFGFDCTTDDYKVIRILYFEKSEYRWPQQKYIMKMKIYSLSTNFWREFECSDLSDIVINPTQYRNIGTLFGNKFCLPARNIGFKRNEWFILSFDMGKEVFQRTPLPSEIVEKHFGMELFHMHDSIALVVVSTRTHIEKTLEIWTTKDLEQGCSSWIKLPSVGPVSLFDRVLGFWKSRNSNDCLFLLESSNDVTKGIYMNKRDQTNTNKWMTIKITNCIDVTIKVLSHAETLVSVNRS